MAESDPSTQSGSDADQTDGEGIYKPVKPKNKSALLGSVRALALKKGVLTHEVDEGSPCLRCGDGCPGFSLHFWRKVCKNCRCQREEHDIREGVKEDAGVHVGKLLFSPTVDTLKKNSGGVLKAPVGFEVVPSPMTTRRSLESIVVLDSTGTKEDKHLWTPAGCSVDTITAYFEALPYDKRPVRKTPGERYRQKQLIRQLPAHDLDIFYCNNLNEEEQKQMEIFIRLRKERSLGKGVVRVKSAADGSSKWTCGGCQRNLGIGDVAVFTDKGGTLQSWHPACFSCADCHELLVDLIYFYNSKDGKIYCGRHHAEKIKPRCAACDELIFCREYTRAEDSDWHLDHFCCLRCDEGLGGQQYRAQDRSPYCLPCYEAAFSTLCERCGELIGLNDPRLTHEEYNWHGTDACFYCAFCKISLVDKAFLPKLGKVFCSKNHAKQFRNSSRK